MTRTNYDNLVGELRTRDIYPLTVLEARSLNQGVGRRTRPLTALGEDPSCLLQPLVVQTILDAPCLADTSLTSALSSHEPFPVALCLKSSAVLFL